MDLPAKSKTSTDYTWSEVPALDLLVVEPSIAFVVACMCVYWPIMEKVLPKSWRKTLGSSRSREDSIKLVNTKNPRNPTGVGSSSGAFSNANSQPQPEDLVHDLYYRCRFPSIFSLLC